MTLEAIKNYFATIHWPQAFFLSVFVMCAFGAPVLFFLMVSPEVLNIMVGLPWLTILGPGVTALLAAAAAIRGFFGPSVFKRAATEQTKVETTTVVRQVEKDDTHEVG